MLNTNNSSQDDTAAHCFERPAGEESLILRKEKEIYPIGEDSFNIDNRIKPSMGSFSSNRDDIALEREHRKNTPVMSKFSRSKSDGYSALSNSRRNEESGPPLEEVKDLLFKRSLSLKEDNTRKDARIKELENYISRLESKDSTQKIDEEYFTKLKNENSSLTEECNEKDRKYAELEMKLAQEKEEKEETVLRNKQLSRVIIELEKKKTDIDYELIEIKKEKDSVLSELISLRNNAKMSVSVSPQLNSKNDQFETTIDDDNALNWLKVRTTCHRLLCLSKE